LNLKNNCLIPSSSFPSSEFLFLEFGAVSPAVLSGRRLGEGAPDPSNQTAQICARCGEDVFSKETTERVRLIVHSGKKPIKSVKMECSPTLENEIPDENFIGIFSLFLLYKNRPNYTISVFGGLISSLFGKKPRSRAFSSSSSWASQTRLPSHFNSIEFQDRGSRRLAELAQERILDGADEGIGDDRANHGDKRYSRHNKYPGDYRQHWLGQVVPEDD
jgi:hypothetical protein